ncbi:MAG: DUF2085 domain-containing protein [Anaerolineales bacterium]
MEQTTQKKRVTGRTRDLVIALDRGILGFARSWLLVFNLFILIFVGLPFLAPTLMKAGLITPAAILYRMYGPPLCHQLAYRSWFLFGERPSYSRGVFEQYTGINPADFWAARDFTGNPEMGYKVAYCERDIAIYGAILLGGLIYSLPFVRQRLKPLHWLAWVLVGLLPIALDGFSQLFSQMGIPPFNLIPFRESTPFLRTLTGGLFGLANVWLAYPYFQESMREVAHDLSVKLARAAPRAVRESTRESARENTPPSEAD